MSISDLEFIIKVESLLPFIEIYAKNPFYIFERYYLLNLPKTMSFSRKKGFIFDLWNSMTELEARSIITEFVIPDMIEYLST